MDYRTWEEYYEKILEWKPSTMVRHMPKLSSFGLDQKGATRMLKKAIDAGVNSTVINWINLQLRILMICMELMTMSY